MKRAASHGTSFGVRTEKMILAVKKTTAWVNVDKEPITLNRYNDGNTVQQPWTVRRRIVRAPGCRVIIPKTK